jgi:Alginate export
MRTISATRLLGLVFLLTDSLTGQGTDDYNLLSRKPSDLLNQQLPSWLRFSGEYRTRWETFRVRGFDNPEDSYLLLRTRFGISVQPVSWFSFYAQTQDARAVKQNVSPALPPYQNSWEFRMGYVQFGDGDRGLLSLRVGRQELNFGDQRLVGSSDWTNTARTFDAARLTWNYRGYRIDAFAASVVDQQDAKLDHHTHGNNLHGLYGSTNSLLPNATVEAYLFWRLAPVRFSPRGETGIPGKLNEKTMGVRLNGRLPRSFDYNIEMAKQFGHLGQDSISAWAGHWLVGKVLGSFSTKPRFVVEFNHGSGDTDPNDGKNGSFDQLYPTGHLKYGLTDQVGWRNINDAHLGIGFNIGKKLKLDGGFHDYWLASTRDGLYNSANGLVSRSRAGTAGRHVGEEIEIYGAYKFSNTLQFLAGYGHLFTGEFLNRTTRGKDYDYPYLAVTWAL